MMKRSILLAGLVVGTSPLALAQTSTTYEQRQTTGQSADGSTATTTTTKTTTSRGSVVSYEQGRTIVLREGDKTVSYALAPNAVIPANVEVGRTVTITTDPTDGRLVSRVVTTDTDELGQTRQKTETRKVDAVGNVTSTKTTEIYGTVQSYEAGKTITVLRPNGEKVVYVINGESQLPSGMTAGKQVTIVTTPGAPQPTVSRVTVTTTDTTNAIQP